MPKKKGIVFESYEDLKGWDKKYQNDSQPFGREFANQIMTNSKTWYNIGSVFQGLWKRAIRECICILQINVGF